MPADQEILGLLADQPPAMRRAAWVVALVTWVHSVEGERLRGSGTVPPTRSAALLRDSGLASSQLKAAERLLRERGLLSPGSGFELMPPAVESRLASPLDWSAIVADLRGEAAALLVCRVVSWSVSVAAEEWSPVTLEEIVQHTAYGLTWVRKARALAVERGVLEMREVPGEPTLYRFSARARGDAEGPPGEGEGPQERAMAVSPAPPAPRPGTQPAAAAGAAPSGIVVCLDGAMLGVAEGTLFDAPPGYAITGTGRMPDGRLLVYYGRI